MSDAEIDLSTRETPAWFDEAKLGVFVFWNPAAIPAFAPRTKTIWEMPDDTDGSKMWRMLPYAEMYQNAMAIPGSLTARHHREHHGDRPYDDFVDEWRDDLVPRWDPQPLADLSVQSGAKYVVLYTKMEDGVLPWPSAHPNPRKQRWQSDRDIVGELGESVRAQGLRYGLGYSGGVDWTFGGWPIMDRASRLSGMQHTEEYGAYVDAHWRELIDRYEPAVLWNDMGYPKSGDIEGLVRHYLRRVPDGIVNNRFHADGGGAGKVLEPSRVYSDFVTPEYLGEWPTDRKWELCRGIGLSFGYNHEETDADYMTATELIHQFVDVVARGGNLLLGVGLTATGDIPWLQAQRFLALGWWLKQNGDAIYATRPWVRPTGVSLEGFDVRFTESSDAVHAIVLGTPEAAAVEVDVWLDEGASVTLEGRPGDLQWETTAVGTRVTLPERPDEQPAMSLRLAPASAVHSSRPS